MKKIIAFTILFSAFAFSQDKGIGLVFFSDHSPFLRNTKSDSIPIYNSVQASSHKPLWFVVTVNDDRRGYHYDIHGSSVPLRENFVEYDYELEGLPIDTLSTSRQWLRVIYGFFEDNHAMTGWVTTQDSNCDFLMWRTWLPKRVLFFEPEPQEPQFYDQPNGKPVLVKLFRIASSGARRFSYSLHPLEVIDSWMKVRVVSPSGMAQLPHPDSPTAWVKYLDSQGRPLVYYYARD